MILNGRDILTHFTKRHANVRKAVAAWVAEVEKATWNSSHDVKLRYPTADPTADPIGGNRMVFDLKGNDYRLVVVIVYRAGVVDVRFIGTHADYDRIDANKV
jgi:mRNA interferase HigB